MQKHLHSSSSLDLSTHWNSVIDRVLLIRFFCITSYLSWFFKLKTLYILYVNALVVWSNCLRMLLELDVLVRKALFQCFLCVVTAWWNDCVSQHMTVLYYWRQSYANTSPVPVTGTDIWTSWTGRPTCSGPHRTTEQPDFTCHRTSWAVTWLPGQGRCHWGQIFVTSLRMLSVLHNRMLTRDMFGVADHLIKKLMLLPQVLLSQLLQYFFRSRHLFSCAASENIRGNIAG